MTNSKMMILKGLTAIAILFSTACGKKSSNNDPDTYYGGDYQSYDRYDRGRIGRDMRDRGGQSRGYCDYQGYECDCWEVPRCDYYSGCYDEIVAYPIDDYYYDSYDEPFYGYEDDFSFRARVGVSFGF